MNSHASAGENRNVRSRLTRFWSNADPDLRRRLIIIYAGLIGFNLIVWGTLLVTSTRYGLLLGLAPIAYGFGLRHAVDPDHIAAIDNTTRKLMHEGKRPVAVGLFFSLGHSTVVFALSVVIAISAAYVKRSMPGLSSVGTVIGTSVSGAFLLVIAGINLIVLLDICRTWRRVVRGGEYDDGSLDAYLNQRGLLARVFRPALRLVENSWNMYLVGLLFGLGFDTATEVGVLGMSASVGADGMPAYLILLLPLLFVAGMSLVDTTDGVAMLAAYGWAHVRPIRKLYYNMNITLISVVVALFVGGIEVLNVIGSATGARGGLWTWTQNVPFNVLGFYIIGIFLGSWIISVGVFKLRGIGKLDDAARRTSAGAVSSGE